MYLLYGLCMEKECVVYIFCLTKLPSGDELWIALLDTGEVITRHLSSDAGWGQADVSRAEKASDYNRVLGDRPYSTILSTTGSTDVPPEVLKRAQLLSKFGLDAGVDIEVFI